MRHNDDKYEYEDARPGHTTKKQKPNGPRVCRRFFLGIVFAVFMTIPHFILNASKSHMARMRCTSEAYYNAKLHAKETIKRRKN